MTLPQRLTALLLLLCVCMPITALDDEHWKKAKNSIDKGIAYLRAQQAEDGSWMPDMGPAVTGLALTALLEQPDAYQEAMFGAGAPAPVSYQLQPVAAD